jgi:hypothetical protein
MAKASGSLSVLPAPYPKRDAARRPDGGGALESLMLMTNALPLPRFSARLNTPSTCSLQAMAIWKENTAVRPVPTPAPDTPKSPRYDAVSGVEVAPTVASVPSPRADADPSRKESLIASKAGSLTVEAGARMRGQAEFGWDDDKALKDSKYTNGHGVERGAVS